MKKQKDLSPWWLIVVLFIALKAVNLIADKFSL